MLRQQRNRQQMPEWPVPNLKEWREMIGDASMKDTATCAAVERKGVSRWCPSMEGLPSISLAVRLSINARCTTRASAWNCVRVCACVCRRSIARVRFYPTMPDSYVGDVGCHMCTCPLQPGHDTTPVRHKRATAPTLLHSARH